MKRLGALLFATALGMAVATSAIAATRDSGPATGTAARAWLAGSVVSVAAGSLTVQVTKTGPHDGQLQGEKVSLAVDASTEIRKGDQPAQLADIRSGDQLGVVFEASGSNAASLLAKRIRIRPTTEPAGSDTEGSAPSASK